MLHTGRQMKGPRRSLRVGTFICRPVWSHAVAWQWSADDGSTQKLARGQLIFTSLACPVANASWHFTLLVKKDSISQFAMTPQNSVSRRRKLNEWDLSPSLFLCFCWEHGIIGITGFLFYRITLVCQQQFWPVSFVRNAGWTWYHAIFNKHFVTVRVPMRWKFPDDIWNHCCCFLF